MECIYTYDNTETFGVTLKHNSIQDEILVKIRYDTYSIRFFLILRVYDRAYNITLPKL